jgi:hypothetical protein
MENEIIWKIVVVAAPLVASLVKYLFSINAATKESLRKEYEFAQQVLDKLAKDDAHPYAIQLGYGALAGSVNSEPMVVAHILTLNRAQLLLKLYRKRESYVELKGSPSAGKLEFTGRFKKRAYRNIMKLVHVFSYTGFFVVAMWPFLISKPSDPNASSVLALLIFTIPSFGYLSFCSLRMFGNIMTIEKLINIAKQTQNDTSVVNVSDDNQD